MPLPALLRLQDAETLAGHDPLITEDQGADDEEEPHHAHQQVADERLALDAAREDLPDQAEGGIEKCRHGRDEHEDHRIEGPGVAFSLGHQPGGDQHQGEGGHDGSPRRRGPRGTATTPSGG